MAKSVWNVDASHSALEFKVKHMMMANVRGQFHDFQANITADPEDLTTAEIDFTVNVNSIDTKDEQREGHLKSADFFDVENYPNLTFKATKIERKSNNEYAMTGDMTIRGVTKPVTFNVTSEGIGKDPWGNERAGFTAAGSLNRKEFGLNWNALLETGGVLVGEQVKINVEIEAVRQA